MLLEGKIAVITGAGSGIGKATAEYFVKEGAKVVGVDLHVEAMKQMEEDMKGSFVGIEGNVAKREDNEHMIDVAYEVFGGCDILVNNAGVIDQMQTVADMEDKIWDRCMQINVTGPMYAMRYFINKKLAENKPGAIVSTSSVGGKSHPTICGAAYAASKAALIQLTRHAAYTYGKQNIRVNAICVGAAPTTGIAATFTNPDMKGAQNSMLINSISIRNAEPIELGRAIAFLASDNASYVNGAALDVDGGWSCG